MEKRLNDGEIRTYIKEITINMLRDSRFKKRLLYQAGSIFDDIDKEERKQILKAALVEVINHYKVRDTDALYKLIMGEITGAQKPKKSKSKGQEEE